MDMPKTTHAEWRRARLNEAADRVRDAELALVDAEAEAADLLARAAKRRVDAAWSRLKVAKEIATGTLCALSKDGGEIAATSQPINEQPMAVAATPD